MKRNPVPAAAIAAVLAGFALGWFAASRRQ